MFENFSTANLYEQGSSILLCFMLAIAVLSSIALIVYRYAIKADIQPKFAKFGFISLYSFFIKVAIILITLISVAYNLDTLNYGKFVSGLLLLCILLIVSLSGLAISIYYRKEPNISMVQIILLALCFLTQSITYALIFFSTEDVVSLQLDAKIWLYITTAILVVAILVITFVFGKRTPDTTQSVVFGATTIALSFALSYIRLFQLPQGGSITLASLLPLMIYSCMFGIKKGVLLGIILGIFNFIQAPYFYHPVQFLLDYPIAFGAIGLAGLIYERKLFTKYPPLQLLLGTIIAVIFRYLSHVLSGIFVFGSAEPENYSAVAWSFLYNAFVFADIAIALVCGCSMFASKQFTNFLIKQQSTTISD